MLYFNRVPTISYIKNMPSLASILRYTPLFLSLLLIHGAAAQVKALDTLLVLDDSIKHVSGNPYVMGYELSELGTADSAELNYLQSSYNPALGIAENAAAGLVATAVIDTMLKNEQNRLIKPLRDNINSGSLSKTSLNSLVAGIKHSNESEVVNYYVPGASQAVLPRILEAQKSRKFDQIYLIQRIGMPVITLSTDNRQVMVVGEIERYAGGKMKPAKKYSGKFAYTKLMDDPKDGTLPLVYWNANGGEKFLKEVGTAFTLMADFAERSPALPTGRSRNDITVLDVGGTVFQVPGKLIEISDRAAYIIDRNDVIRIIGGQSIREQAPKLEYQATPASQSP